MKLSAISTAAAVGLALASVSAHAALTPPTVTGGNFVAPSVAPTNTGLMLAIFNTAGTQSDVVNLNYDQAAVNLASGNLTPTTAGGAFQLASNPTGAAGQVLQVNFGIVPGFSTVAGLTTTNYMVVGGITGGAGTEQAVVTSNATPVTAYSGVSGLINHIQTEAIAWNQNIPNSGFLQDTTGTTLTTPLSSQTLNGGQLITNQQFSGAVGTALGFYNITTTSNHVAHDTAYTNGTSTNGFFFLTSNGDLTYNIGTSGTAPVPLPPAAWLFGSGLLGMVGIARRRRTQV
jgi:hypothetical protein